MNAKESISSRTKYLGFGETEATAGNGYIDFFPISVPSLKIGQAESLVRHEFGHVLAFKLWGTIDPPAEYKRLALKDNLSISAYGSTSWPEDFAEAMDLYLEIRTSGQFDYRKKLYAHRLSFLDQIFGVVDIDILRKKFGL